MTKTKKKCKARTNSEQMNVEHLDCPRCGYVHEGIVLRKFENPMKYGKAVWTHWCMCPNVFEPVMLGNEKRKK